jgi:RNA polymerase sigma-70 factor (sigma-E family)
MARHDAQFTEYVAARRSTLYRTAYLLCGDAHQAEDIVQTALAKVYAHWRRLDQVGEVDAYVRRIVVNAHLDDVRRPWRRRERPGLDGYDVALAPGVPAEDSDALWTALRGLAPGQRRVVVLRHYWGLSVEETAADLGISRGTVKSQTADALARLRTALTTTTHTGEH